MNMMTPRLRGIVAARAEGTPATPQEQFAELQRRVSAFIETHTQQIEEVRGGLTDVVRSEQVDRISGQVTEAMAAIERLNAQQTALMVGPGGSPADPAAAEHHTAFNAYMRRGAEAGLGDLQVQASLSAGSDADGGYLVPEETDGQITELLRTISVMRQLAEVRTVGTSKFTKLINRQGAGTGWVGETESRPETSTPTLSELEFPLHELYANPAATQQVLDDATIDLAGWLASEVQEEFAEAEGAAFISGNGIRRPRGLLSYDTVANASYAWGSVGYIAGGSAAALPTSNPGDKMIALQMALRPGYQNNASWLMNQGTAESVLTFKDGDGQYLWRPGLTADAPMVLLGKSWRIDENMPAVGANAYPIAYGDIRRAYLILDRMGVRVTRDPFTNKPYVHFYTTKRVGGGIQNFEAVKLFKIATS